MIKVYAYSADQHNKILVKDYMIISEGYSKCQARTDKTQSTQLETNFKNLGE